MAYRLLLVADDEHNIEEVVSYLRANDVVLSSTSNPETGLRLFEKIRPDILCLGFRNIASATVYKRKLPHKPHLFQTILMCQTSERANAANLVIEKVFDDYFLFKPIYDLNRLRVCIQHALSRRAALQKLRTYKAKFSQSSHILDQALSGRSRLKSDSMQSHEQMVRQAGETFDEFKNSMTGPELKEVIKVLDAKKIDQHFNHFKEKELGGIFANFKSDLFGSFDKGFEGVIEQAREASRLENDNKRRRPYSVLIVEDDPYGLELVDAMLSVEGFKTNQARNAGEAAARVSKHKPDLILMDMRLPGMSGLELTQKFHEQPATKDIPIMLLSAHISEEVVLQACKLGVKDVIAKPIKRKELLERVAKTLPQE